MGVEMESSDNSEADRPSLWEEYGRDRNDDVEGDTEHLSIDVDAFGGMNAYEELLVVISDRGEFPVVSECESNTLSIIN